MTTVKSPIVFRHPYQDISNYYWDDSLIEEWTTMNSPEIKLKLEPNTLIIFPAWVWHKVLPNKEDTDRISFSFNTIIHEKGNG